MVRVLLGLFLALCPASVHADWLQYALGTLHIVGYSATQDILPTATTGVLDTGAVVVVFPPLDGCAGRPEWAQLLSLAAPYTNAQLGVRPGVACFRATLVTSQDEVDALVADLVRQMQDSPALALQALAQRTVDAACAGGASTACTDAQADRLTLNATFSARERNAAATILRVVRVLRAQAEAFKLAHPELP